MTNPEKFIGINVLAMVLLSVDFYSENYFMFGKMAAVFALCLLPPLIIKTKIDRRQVAFICVFDVGIVLLLKCIFKILINVLWRNAFDNIGIYMSFSIIFTLIIIYILRMDSMQVLIQSFSKARSAVHILFVAMWLLSLFFFGILSYNKSKKVIDFFIIVLIAALLSALVMMCIVLTKDVKIKKHYKKSVEILESNISNQMKLNEEKQKTYDELRIFKHDYENLKIGFYSYLKNNDIDGAKAYLSKFTPNFSAEMITVNTGSQVLDAIIFEKQLRAENYNISIVFDGIFPYDAMHAMDICVMFGNALDNAIEASRHVSELKAKEISVSVRKNKQLLLVRITNPVSNDIDIKNNSIKTTKADTKNHGIGIYSIKKTVEKYNGFCELKCNNKIFSIELGIFIGCHAEK